MARAHINGSGRALSVATPERKPHRRFTACWLPSATTSHRALAAVNNEAILSEILNVPPSRPSKLCTWAVIPVGTFHWTIAPGSTCAR